ncbi:MAG TPA: OmpA family protein [Saprospiraceae bacterium]|jgi:chemotaxis protein MotB|nr:OmpA family protein [Saprospiraceae bacterium]HMP14287.1 OmpA family protein [Saprospiraceae bacterium]
MKKYFLLLPVLAIVFNACVSKKQFLMKQAELDELRISCDNRVNDLNARYAQLEREKSALAADLRQSESNLLICNTSLENEKSKNRSLEQQMEYLKATNTNLLDRLSDLSVVSKTGAESIKKSLEALNEQNKYIQDLTSSMQRKDSLNLALVVNLKRSLSDVNDEDVTIEVKKGVVYISLSDKMLFRSGSADINQRAEEVLAKIARVVNDHTELDILVEGHTDNVPISTACLKDNWDLSVMRATSVVRLLQTKYNVKPDRMTAGGRSEFVPKTSNATAASRAINRRTEIIILPKLDQFFDLMTPPTAEKK